MKIVLDTNVLVSALIKEGAPVLNLVYVGLALFNDYLVILEGAFVYSL